MRRRFALLAIPLAALMTAATVPVVARASGTATSASPVGVEQILFRSGTGGYGCFRIPALVRTGTGTLLAFAEGRTSPSCADRGDIDIVMRRSTNDGRTWGPIRAVLRRPCIGRGGHPAEAVARRRPDTPGPAAVACQPSTRPVTRGRMQPSAGSAS